MASYEDVLSIDTFLGLNESREDNVKLSYAVEGENFLVDHGVLQSMPASRIVPCAPAPDGSDGLYFGEEIVTQHPWDDEENTNADRSYGGTLAFLTQRWKQGVSGVIPSMAVWAIAVVQDHIYARREESSASNTNYAFFNKPWVQLADNEGNEITVKSATFDTLTYEMNYEPPETLTTAICGEIYDGDTPAEYYAFDAEDYQYHKLTSSDGTSAEYTNSAGEIISLTVGESKVRFAYLDASIDALLISNAEDGMFCIYAPMYSDKLKIVRVPVAPGGGKEMKFGCIELHSERIWGSGILDEPDKLVYSAPGDVFNWEQNNDSPADGAGDIQQPEWDGDRFISLKTFGSHLLAIKEYSLWRIVGTNPEEYSMKKQYGMGTNHARSVVAYNSSVYMVSENGILVYDGSGTRYLKYGALKNEDFSNTDNYKYDDVIAAMYKDNYCIRMGKMGEEQTILYNTVEGTFCKKINDMEDVKDYADNYIWQNDVTAFATYKNKLYAISTFETEGLLENDGADSFDYPLAACLIEVFGNHPLIYEGSAGEMNWKSAWQDMGAKNVAKSAFEIYMCVASQNFEEDFMPMFVGIETERKRKIKKVVFQRNVPKRIRLNASGRRFRLVLQAASGFHWALQGGIQIKLEYDYD